MSLTRRLGDFARKFLSTGTDVANLRAALGLPPIPSQYYAATTQLNNIDIPIPAEATWMSVRGVFIPTVLTAQLLGRFSLDGGATYKAGATDYLNGYLYSSTSVSTAYADAPHMFLSLTVADATVVNHLNVNSQIALGTGDKYPSHQTVGNGYAASAPATNVIYSGYSRMGTKPTHLRILPSAANIGVGSKFRVDFM